MGFIIMYDSKLKEAYTVSDTTDKK